MKISYKKLINKSSNFLNHAGVSKAVSKIVSKNLVEADMSGHFSHGIIRLIQYYNDIKLKRTNPKAVPKLIDKKNFTIIDSNRCFGQLAMKIAIKNIINKKKDISITAVNNCSHIGRLSDYLEKLSNNNFVNLIFCNGGGPNVAIYPSAERICGTNPFGFGMPVKKNHNLIVDFSTAMLAEGKVRIARIKKRKLKYKAIINNKGHITNNPEDLYKDGALLPFGEKKGSGLMLACEILGGLLISNNNPINKKYLDGNNCLIIAFKKKLFDYNKKYFINQFQTLIKKITKSKKLASINKSSNYMPGQWEKKNYFASRRKGITVNNSVLQELKIFAKQNGFEF